MKVNIIIAISFIGMVLVTPNTIFSDKVYGLRESGGFVQDTNFTITEVKDGILKFGGITSSGFVGNGTMSVHLEFKNGSKVSYNDVKTLGVEYGRGFIHNNNGHYGRR